MTRLLLALLLLWLPAAAAAQDQPTALFASDEPVRITLQGPIAAVASGSRSPRQATLHVQGAAPESLPVQISPRGITRLKRDVCQFAPLRLEFTRPAPSSSLFAGQRRLKLVTHCRAPPGFQQHVLLEYAAYRLYNQLTPASYRVRLASIDYVDERGRLLVSRLGFFIEDISDVARRNGVIAPPLGERIATAHLSAADSARMALFEYMIGNLDWSPRAGPPGEVCCHNARLISARGDTGKLVPVPYDFDFSGLVDAPYATPPDIVPVRSVRQRHYRGFCVHDAEALATARELRGKRGELQAVLASIPQMEERTRRKAAAYLDGFFADIADDSKVARLLRTCIR